MSTERARVFSREFKLAAVSRVVAGENVRAVADELGVWPKLLYDWRKAHERGGPDALRLPGRPRKALAPVEAPEAKPTGAAPERIAELERKVGQQAVELDFFKQALRHVRVSRPPSGGPGAPASSRSSPR